MYKFEFVLEISYPEAVPKEYVSPWDSWGSWREGEKFLCAVVGDRVLMWMCYAALLILKLSSGLF
jgi:hypothetical protein